MDSDTTRRKNAHWEMLDRFKAGEAQVLLGTQMIAKGLDIPSVTLVGIINADTSLGLPDFRAAERTFQLITQVSGRAGRGLRPGRVIIQTFNPEHYSIVPVASGQQDSFFPQEMEFRREAGYPPFSHLINLVFSSPSEEHGREAAREMQRRLSALLPDDCRLLGPAPAPISRLKGRHRHHLIVKTPAIELAAEALREALPGFEAWRSSYCSSHKLPHDSLSLAVDVDPVSLL
jgi:primosomal protein N' (replication factor Y)